MALRISKMAISRFCLCLIITCCTGSCAQAWWDDWEVETFTRYRIDNFDNNNNGYVDLENETALLGRIERFSVAEAVEHKSGTISIPLIEDGYRALADLFESPASSTSYTSSASSESIAAARSASVDSVNLSTSSNYGVPVPTDDLDSGESYYLKSYSQYRGMMLEGVIGFRNRTRAEKGLLQRNSWELSYGVRFADQLDSLRFAADSLLGNSLWLSQSRSEKVGPYLGVKWTTQKPKWSLTTGGRLQYAFDTSRSLHDLSFPQTVGFPSRSVFGSIEHSEAMLGELQILFTLPLSDKIDFGLGYSGYFLGQIVDSAGAYVFVPPDHLYQDPAVNVAAGVAFASLEVRR